MRHLSEEQLLVVYYREEESAVADAHLAACQDCATRYARLKQSLEMIKPAVASQRGAVYGERVWQTLRPKLIRYQKKAPVWEAWTHWRGGAWAFGCAILLIAGFLAGRYWERATPKNAIAIQNPEAANRMALVMLTEHLDQAERLLVELEHTSPSDGPENAQLQSEAEELLASNRLYRQTAGNAGDPAIAGALDRLEGVLAEVANDPNLTAADLERVRKEMNVEGILFEIRVLLERNPERQSRPKTQKGVSI